jgi:hypothetical protein
MHFGSVAVIALIAGFASGAVGAAVVGTVEGMLRQRHVARNSATYGGRQIVRSTHVYVATDRLHGDAPVTNLNDLAKRETSFDHLDTDSRKVMTLARQEAIQSGHSYMGSENLAMALRLYSTPALDRVWRTLAIDPDTMRRRIEAAVPPTLGTMPTEGVATSRVSRIIALANTIAADRKREAVPPEFLLQALADEGGGAGAQVLASLGATAQRIREIVDEPTS